MEKEQKKKIEETVSGIISKMGFAADVDIVAKKDGSVVCDIKVAKDPHLLIGQHGINLLALQHISRLLVRKKSSEKMKFTLDVNGYCQQKNELICRLAREAAEQAVRERKTVVMRPMSPHERRLVHLELAGDKNVETESMGEGEERKVAVRPAGEIG